MKNIKLVALDVDGTLLNQNHEISEANKKEIDRLLNQGILVTACTGRPIEQVPEFLLKHKKLKYVIGANGASIYDVNKEAVCHQLLLNKEQALSLYQIAKEYSYATTLVIKDRLYSHQSALDEIEAMNQPKFLEFFKNSRTLVDDLEAFIKETEDPIIKISFNFDDTSLRQEAMTKLAQIEGVAVTSSFEHNIEVSHKDATKGNAIKILMEEINCSNDQVLVIGDNYNDISMFELTPHSFAMGNAPEAVKKAANHVTKTNLEDGVAHVLRRIP